MNRRLALIVELVAPVALLVNLLAARQLPSATEVADQWSTRLGQSGDKITRGVQRVNEDPGAKAARQADVWANNTIAAKEKFRRNVVTGIENWRSNTIGAVARVADGASRKKGKYEAKVAPVLQHMQGVLNALDSMPRGSIDQNINRAVTFMRGMSQYRSPGGGA